jgi:glucosylceramidase
MEFTPQSMTDFLAVLGPTLDAAVPDVKLIIHDHNRDHVVEWVNTITANATVAPHVDGTGVHWYSSTYLVREGTLDAVHDGQGPDHLILNTEGSVGLGGHGAPGDWWNWWWEINLGGPQPWHPDGGVDFPEYVPVYRVVRDMTVGLNHWFNGWISWNLALDDEGYPRHAGGSGNTAPFMIDLDSGEIHVTPIFYALAHFSKYLRPGARVLATTAPDGLLATAAWNPDGTIAVVVANITVGHPDGYDQVVDRSYRLQIGDQAVDVDIPAHSFQTLVVTPAG